MAKNKFKTGNVDIPSECFDHKKAKIRISMWMDMDILDAYREAAKSTSHGEYQTLMKEALRSYLNRPSSPTSLEVRIARLEAQVKEVSQLRVLVIPYVSLGASPVNIQTYPLPELSQQTG